MALHTTIFNFSICTTMKYKITINTYFWKSLGRALLSLFGTLFLFIIVFVLLFSVFCLVETYPWTLYACVAFGLLGLLFVLGFNIEKND